MFKRRKKRVSAEYDIFNFFSLSLACSLAGSSADRLKVKSCVCEVDRRYRSTNSTTTAQTMKVLSAAVPMPTRFLNFLVMLFFYRSSNSSGKQQRMRERGGCNRIDDGDFLAVV